MEKCPNLTTLLNILPKYCTIFSNIVYMSDLLQLLLSDPLKVGEPVPEQLLAGGAGGGAGMGVGRVLVGGLGLGAGQHAV